MSAGGLGASGAGESATDLGPGGSGPLICPECGHRHGADVRFCARCHLPLVHDRLQVQAPPVSERHAMARKIKPQLAEGPLVKVAYARNQTEGEFIQGLLLEEGVPSILRRSAGFDVPDMLAAGPRDVLVPQSGVDVARDVLLEADVIADEVDGPPPRVVVPGRLAAGLLAACVLGALIVWAFTLVVH